MVILSEEGNLLVAFFCSADCVVLIYLAWLKEQQHVETGYQNLYFLLPEIQAPSFVIEVKWTLNELIAYISTWSEIKCLKEQQGEADIGRFQQQLA